jgi:DNA-binding NtrC family response regulator
MPATVEVLLVGQTPGGSAQLSQWLEQRGCRCHFVSSCKEACRLVQRRAFGLVLSHFELPDRSAYPLLERLIGSSTTLFFSTIVEDGCLWLPTLIRGKKWPHSRAIRPREFAQTLGDALERARSHDNEASLALAAD